MGYLSPPPMPAPVIVVKDVGGLVTDYEARTEQYRRENREVRLHECRSACTLALSLPNVCVYPDAKVKFHQAYNALNRETDYGVSAKLFASYPAPVQARLGGLTRDYRVLSGTELIALGVRNCAQNDSGVMVAARKTRALASSIASAAPNANPNPWGDIAHRVQTAVASALATPPEKGQGTIRVAVADRSRAPDAMSRLISDARPEGLTDASREAETDAPLPPRRPPSTAFLSKDVVPAYRRLINGAQPILAHTQFVRSVTVSRD